MYNNNNNNNLTQFNSWFLRANSKATGANYRVSTIKEIESEGNNTEM
jgi:hypothetical protein